MTFSQEWDERYRQGTHLSIWPWTDLVSLVLRTLRPIQGTEAVLELGCGAGANIPFFRKLGVHYQAIEGSETMVAELERQYPELRGSIHCGDFTQALPGDHDFDLIVDRAALTHNTTAAIRQCLGHVLGALKPGGRFVGIDWFATEHSEASRGQLAEDEYTRTGYDDGPFAGVGRVHYSDRAHLEDLFQEFELEGLDKKIHTREHPSPPWVQATWNFIARKSAS